MAFKKLTDLSSSLSPSGDSVLPISDGDQTYKVTLDTVRSGSLTDIIQIKGKLDSIEAESGSIRTDFNDFKDSYLIVSQSFNDRISALENYHLPTATPNATLAPTSTPTSTPNATPTPTSTPTATATVEPVNLTEGDRILNVASYYTSNNVGGNVGSTFETNNQTNTYDQILQWMCDNDTHISSALANQGTVDRPNIYSVGGTLNVGDKIYRDVNGTLFTDEGFSLYSVPGPLPNASGNSWVSVDSNSNIVSVTPFSCVVG